MIKYIKVQNFKSVVESTAKLPIFGAVVGYNAAGKTNLVQSIKFVRELACGVSTTEIQRKISLVPKELLNITSNSKIFKLELEIEPREEENYLYNVKIELANGTTNPAQLIIVEESLVRLLGERKETVFYRERDNNIQDKDGKPIPLSVDSRGSALFLYKTPNCLVVKNAFEQTYIPDSQEFIISKDFGTVGSDDNTLTSLLINLRHKNAENYVKFQTIVKKMLPQFSSVVEIPLENRTNPDSKETYLVVLEERQLKQRLSLQVVSGGDLKTLYIVALALYADENSSLIIEEIENGLHPRRVTELLEHLEIVSTRKNMQILFTTHSPMVINYLKPSQVLLAEKTQDKGTQYVLLENSEQISHIKDLLSQGGKMSDIFLTNEYR